MRMAMAAAAMAVAVAVAATGCAGTREASEDLKAAVPGLEQTQEGVVVSIDDQRMAVAIPERPLDPPVEFSRQDDTEVSRGDEEDLGWSEIREGSPVRVSFEPASGAEPAKSVEILTGQEAEQVKARTKANSVPPPAWPKPGESGPGGMQAPSEAEESWD